VTKNENIKTKESHSTL